MKNLYILTLLLIGRVVFGQDLSPEAKEKMLQLKSGFCGTTPPTEIAATEQFIQTYQNNMRNARPSADPVYIPIKVHVVVNDAGDLPDPFFFNPKSFNESLAATNAIYKSANIQFYFTGTINYIKSTKLLDLNVRSSTNFTVDGFTQNADEDELCKAHEIPNAINLFLAKTLKLDNGAAGIQLPAGYAPLPTSTSISKYNTNRIIMDTQHFGGTSNQTDYTLTHELGHFFGLYHTFDTALGKELATRGTGANCSTAGDLVCDTPADPYSSLPAGSADFQTCGTFLSTLKDANGQSYTTDKSNIMSYYANYCARGFTQGQFDRINASLALRKTNSTYGKFDAPDTQVAPATLLNSIAYNGGNVWLSIKDNANNETGYILERATSATGEFTAIKGYAENANSFSDELFDIDTKNIPKLYYRVKASNSKNGYSSVWEVAVTPKKYCIPGMNTKCADDVRYPEFSTIKSTGTNLDETINPCLNPSNYAYLTKTIVMQTNSNYTIDGVMRYSISLPFDIYAYIDVNKNGVFDNNERIYFTNTKNAAAIPTFSFNLNTANLSGEYGVRIKAGYTLDVNADACSAMFWGETIDFTVNVLGPLAVKAGAIATASVCPNTVITVPFTYEGSPPTASTKYSLQLSDNQGNNFKELVTTLDGTNLKATIPANTVAGSGYKVKVVSISPASESVSSSTLTVKPLPTATFQTNALTIQQFASADVKVNLIGDAPWKVALSDGKSYDVASSPATISLSPNVTTDYTLTSVSNTCGNGTVSSTALKITVIPAPFITRISDVTPQSLCPNTGISVTFTTEGTAGAGNKFGLQLSDAQGTNYQDLATTTDGNTLKATVPMGTAAGTGYKLRITTSSPAASSGPSATSLTVKPLPTAAFESTAGVSMQQYSAIDIKVTLTGDAPWKVGLSDGKSYDAASSPASMSLSPNATTDYTLTSVSNVCGNGTVATAALKITVIPVLSVGLSSNSQIEVYPNPTSEVVVVNFDKTKRGEKTVELFDTQGRRLQHRIVTDNSIQMSLKELPSGAFYLKIQQGEATITKKVLKD